MESSGEINWALDHVLFCCGNPVQHDECCATGYRIGDARLPQQKRRARAAQYRCVFGVCIPTGLRPPFQAAGHSDNFSTFEFTAENRFFVASTSAPLGNPNLFVTSPRKRFIFSIPFSLSDFSFAPRIIAIWIVSKLLGGNDEEVCLFIYYLVSRCGVCRSAGVWNTHATNDEG